jgi:Recombinase
VNEHLSLGKIATRARERHAPTRYDFNNKKKPRNGPCFWSKGTLKRILSSEVYTGTAWFRKYLRSDAKLDPAKLRPESEWIKVSVPPLISAHMLQMARGQLAKNRANSPRRAKRTYLFAKKLRCRVCARVITAAGASNSEYKYYRGTYWTDKRCLECRFYSEAMLEGAIWPGLVALFRNPAGFLPVLEKHRARESKQGQISQERSEFALLEERLKRSEKLLLACELECFYSRDVLQEKRRELDTERKILDERKHELSKMILAEEQRQEAVASAKTLYGKIQKKLDCADYGTKRLAFSLFVDRVVLSRQRADVWLKIPREMAAAQVVQTLSGNGAAGDNLSLRRNSYMKRDTKTRRDKSLRTDSQVKRDTKTLHQWMPVPISIELKPRYGNRGSRQPLTAS